MTKIILNNMLNESFINEMQCNEDAVFTGEQIADMVGMGDIYRKGKQEVEHDNQMRESFRNRFANLTERMEKTPKGMEKDFD